MPLTPQQYQLYLTLPHQLALEQYRLQYGEVLTLTSNHQLWRDKLMLDYPAFIRIPNVDPYLQYLRAHWLSSLDQSRALVATRFVEQITSWQEMVATHPSGWEIITPLHPKYQPFSHKLLGSFDFCREASPLSLRFVSGRYQLNIAVTLELSYFITDKLYLLIKRYICPCRTLGNRCNSSHVHWLDFETISDFVTHVKGIEQAGYRLFGNVPPLSEEVVEMFPATFNAM